MHIYPDQNQCLGMSVRVGSSKRSHPDSCVVLQDIAQEIPRFVWLHWSKQRNKTQSTASFHD